MSLLITFNRAASAELSEATAWYESKRIGLGKEFIAEIEQLCDAASEHPLQFAVVHKDIRRVVAKRFPFSVSSALLFDLPCRAEKRSSGSLPKI